MPPSRHVYILTHPADFHAHVVGEVLRRKGASVGFWFTADLPSRQTGSIEISGDKTAWSLSGLTPPSRAQEVSLWLRGARPPVLPAGLSRDDEVFAGRECNAFLRSCQAWLGLSAFWVNPPQTHWRAVLKSEQLRAATQAGFRVPTTLISNNPEDIRAFTRAHQDPGVIYKPFYPAAWQTDEGLAVAYTAKLGEDDFPDDDILQAVPGIFQEYIEKSFELRVTAVGQRLFAAKINSQEIDTGRIDWRRATGAIALEPFELSSELAACCQQVLADLGLVYGCFDLIVTPQGEVFFLEINEMGAFLWVDERLPEMGLLDAFAELLLQASSDFLWRRPLESRPWFGIVEATARQQLAKACQRHLVTASGQTFIEHDPF